MKNSEFEKRNKEKIRLMALDKSLLAISKKWFLKSYKYEYSYHFKWLGRPIIQYPQDIIALQEIIWKVKPDLIVETGIAHGGSLIFSASMLELIGNGEVLGIDVDIREYNRVELEKHPLRKRLNIIEGSSIDKRVTKKVYEFAKGKKRIMIILDSDHTHKHVLKELRIYSQLVTKGSYLIVFDTVIDDMPKGYFAKRRWDVGNNPKSAVREFLRTNDHFRIDREFQNKLLITVARDGYLKCVKE